MLGKLAAIIKGNRPGSWDTPHQSDHLLCHCGCLFVGYFAYECQTAFAVNKRHQMGILTMNLITFPVAKAATPVNNRRSSEIALAIGNKGPSCLAFTAFPACFSEAREKLLKLASCNWVFLQQAINRRVAYMLPEPPSLHATTDVFWRPAQP